MTLHGHYQTITPYACCDEDNNFPQVNFKDDYYLYLPKVRCIRIQVYKL